MVILLSILISLFMISILLIYKVFFYKISKNKDTAQNAKNLLFHPSGLRLIKKDGDTKYTLISSFATDNEKLLKTYISLAKGLVLNI